MSRHTRAVLAAFLLAGCSSAPAQAPSPLDDALTRVTVIHGGHGPWAVAGYRMGQHALKELDIKRGSLELMVTHHAPGMVQYSCIADGAAAATGASAGRQNLAVVMAPLEELRTTYYNRLTKKTLVLKPSAAFAFRFKDVPYERLDALGEIVLTLPDSAVFDTVP